MNFDESPWEPDAELEAEPEPSQPPSQATRSQGAPMYEPPPPPASQPSPQDAPANQWAPYEQSYFVPPRDDFSPEPLNVPAPPPGRMYGMYRQPPTWQHASMMGLGDTTISDIFASFLSNLAAIAGGGALGYFLTGHWKGVAGGALAVMGAAQIPQIPKSGGMTRLFIAAGSFVGAYFLLRDESGYLHQRAFANDWDYDDAEENEGEDDESDDDRSEPEGKKTRGGQPSDDPAEPAQFSPWLKQVG